MASDSHTVRLPCLSTGTLPAIECFAICAPVSGCFRVMTVSSKARPLTFIAIPWLAVNIVLCLFVARAMLRKAEGA